MQVTGTGNITYILLNGIAIHDSVRLNDSVELQPADTSHLDLPTTISACVGPDDIAVAAAFIPRITAQLEITAPTPSELAIAAWNSSWDVLLLSALFQTEIGFNLQSSTVANAISADSTLRATNLYMRGLTNRTSYQVTDDDSLWIKSNFAAAQQLLKYDQFQTAVHCLATYRWHSMARVQLAILWAGIEGVFGASTEIRFRISLYLARFLYPTDTNKRQATFAAVKRLYDSRSAAVHGSKIKGDISDVVDESAGILCKLLRECVDRKSMPDEGELVP
jgi:Apea-like HEPN